MTTQRWEVSNCKACGSTLHPPEDCWTLHPELLEKAKAEGRLGKRHK